MPEKPRKKFLKTLNNVYSFEMHEPIPWIDDLTLGLSLRRAASHCKDEAAKLFDMMDQKKVDSKQGKSKRGKARY